MGFVTCIDDAKNKFESSSNLVVTTKITNGLSARISSSSNIKCLNGIFRGCSSSLKGVSQITVAENVNFGPQNEMSESAIGYISAYTIATLGVNQRLLSSGTFKTNKTDKFSGYSPTFSAYEKLYPTQDISFKSKFSNANIDVYKKQDGLTEFSNIYTSIDDGVFIGDYTQNGKIGSIISDDSSSIAFTSAIFNSGDIEYKFKVNTPQSVARLSYLAIRASAPFDSYSQKLPQKYKIYDIKFEDPSGNLIIQYEDITIRGDSKFTTYISKPKINNLLLPTWNNDYPLMGESDPYTLRMSFGFDCNLYPFNTSFDSGYENTCIINKNILNPNPFISLDISAIEIGNSGGAGLAKDNFLNLFSQVTDQPNRVRRIISPSQILSYNFDNNIYPQASSIWTTSINDSLYDNITPSGADKLLSRITTNFISNYITLSSTSPHSDSGRLLIKFGTSPKDKIYPKNVGGAFAFGGSDSFNDSILVNYQDNDEFFNVDKLELKVVARKAVGGQDYPIDVVGYSDDKLLNVTSSINGFVQNSDLGTFNDQIVPDVSGFYTRNIGISDSAFSDQSSYYLRDITSKGDHYILSSPVVNSTSFKEYTIPLTIYEDNLKFGNTRYSSSSFFENLYLDISPIPSGASINKIELVVYYRPSNALMLNTLAGPSNKKAAFTDLTLIPSSSGTINTIPKLSGQVLTGFKSPSYLKTNYSRRWRGNTGDIFIGGDFKRNFDFSFNHKQSNTVLNSYVNFTNCNGQNIYDHNNIAIGSSFNSDLNILHNFGWRYSSEQFIDGITTDYSSLSWNNNIYDNFDRALRIGNDYIGTNFLTSSDDSFVLFLKYTPDKVSDTELNNHIIMCCEESDWSIALVVENEYLKLKINNTNSVVSTISDTIKISQYSFPLPILITYNSATKNFKLYTDNQLIKPFNRFRGEITINSYISSTINYFGYSNYYTSLISIPMFLHEIGYSSGCHIVDSNPNRYLNQITADDFFDSYNVLSNNIDDNISEWRLGAFKVCQFSPDFDFFTKRVGRDFIIFNLNHSGSGYYQTTDLSFPTDINLSGVSYHSQIENDFLRFEVSDIPYINKDNFYAISPRISKTLPRGYTINSESIVIDSIIEHDTNSEILWPDGKIGPKLIISLYTKNQDSNLMPDKSFGLINKSNHYLEPSGCIRKLSSKFNFNDLFDESEPWAKFDKDIYQKEFTERFLSKDVDDMFLQYDLVYPSGRPINSLIKLHSTNIHLDNVIGFFANDSGNLNLSVSGGYHSSNQLNIYASGSYSGVFDHINLNIFGDKFFSSGQMSLLTSGGLWNNQNLNMYSYTIGTIDTSINQFFATDYFGSSPSFGLNLYCSGQLMTETYMPLYVSPLIKYDNGSLNLFSPPNISEAGYIFDPIDLYTLGTVASYNPYPISTMSIYTYGQEYSIQEKVKLPLFVKSYEPSIFYVNNNLNLFTLNYPISQSLINFSATIKWDNNNVGQSITSIDNAYAYIDADDNIRGVDLSCYGDCKK